MIHVLPIEPYEARYTEQWNRWFQEYLTGNSIPYAWHMPTVGRKVLDNQRVLDPCLTHIHKFSQLRDLFRALDAGEVSSDDTIFLHDLWFPGMESLDYARRTLGVSFRIVGVLHAGSYDPADFTVREDMARWAQHSERAWLTVADEIFVATEYHKRLLLAGGRSADPARIKVTGLPLVRAEVTQGRETVKKVSGRIAFPHRNVPEKDPDLAERIARRFPGCEVIHTRSLTKTRDEYYDLLATCEICVSNSAQETFGYSMAEASALGCIPLVPNRLAYPELYPEEFRFNTEEHLFDLIDQYHRSPVDPRPQLDHLWHMCDTAIATMVSRCLI
jgi:hypothetical protein